MFDDAADEAAEMAEGAEYDEERLGDMEYMMDSSAESVHTAPRALPLLILPTVCEESDSVQQCMKWTIELMLTSVQMIQQPLTEPIAVLLVTETTPKYCWARPASTSDVKLQH